MLTQVRAEIILMVLNYLLGLLRTYGIVGGQMELHKLGGKFGIVQMTALVQV